jgi:hypothetical protein
MDWSRWPFCCRWGTQSGQERCSQSMKSQRGTRHLAAMLLAIPPAPHRARRSNPSLDTTLPPPIAPMTPPITAPSYAPAPPPTKPPTTVHTMAVPAAVKITQFPFCFEMDMLTLVRSMMNSRRLTVPAQASVDEGTLTQRPVTGRCAPCPLASSKVGAALNNSR